MNITRTTPWAELEKFVRVVEVQRPASLAKSDVSIIDALDSVGTSTGPAWFDEVLVQSNFLSGER